MIALIREALSWVLLTILGVGSVLFTAMMLGLLQ